MLGAARERRRASGTLSIAGGVQRRSRMTRAQPSQRGWMPSRLRSRADQAVNNSDAGPTHHRPWGATRKSRNSDTIRAITMPATNQKGSLRGGIDLGGTKIEAIVVDSEHNVVGQARRPTPTEGGPKDVADQIAQALTDAADAAHIKPSDLVGLGVGSPGVIDEAKGTVTSARNLPNWEGEFGLGATLSDQLGTPVFLGNDVQVATQAEFDLGAGRPYKSLLGVFWGTGVGGGLILDGRPWVGGVVAGWFL